MIRLIYVTLAVLAVSGIAAAQCAKPEMLVEWDSVKGGFTCRSGGGGSSSLPNTEPSKDPVFTSPEDRRNFCLVAHANLLKVCPRGAPGRACRKKADSLFARCIGDDPEATGEVSDTGFPLRMNAKSCETDFRIQLKACRKKKQKIRSPGDEPVADTCEADARTARDDCLAQSK